MSLVRLCEAEWVRLTHAPDSDVGKGANMLSTAEGNPRSPIREDSLSAGAVLVTGANGFIGRHLVGQLRVLGADVIAVDHAWVSRSDLESLVGGRPFSTCVHLGWYACPRDYLTAETENLRSLRSSIELVSFLLDQRCAHLTVAGTSAEYGKSASSHVEADELSDRTSYARTKGVLRDLLAELSVIGELPTAWCRIFSLTGPGEHRLRLLPTVVRSLQQGKPIELTDGSQVRDYLDVRDVASALNLVMRKQFRGPVNICSGRRIVLKDLLTQLASRFGRPELLLFGLRERSAYDADVVVGDNGRLRALGWEEARTLTETLDDLVVDWSSRVTEW